MATMPSSTSDFGLGEMASNSSVQIRQSLQEKTQFTVNSNELGWLVSSIRKHDRQYRQTWDINDLETVICLYRAALEFFRVKSAYAQIRCHDDSGAEPLLPISEGDLSESMVRFDKSRNENCALSQGGQGQLLDQRSDHEPFNVHGSLPDDMSVLMCRLHLAQALEDHYTHTRRLEDVEEQIRLGRMCVECLQAPSEVLTEALLVIATGLLIRHERLSENRDLEESIKVHQRLLACCLEGHHLRHTVLCNLGRCLFRQFSRTAQQADLEKSIMHLHDALALTPVGHADRHECLYHTAHVSWMIFLQGSSDFDGLHKALARANEALHLRDKHRDRHISLNTIGAIYFTLYEETTQPGYLEEAVRYHREALAMRPPGHPYRAISLNNLTQTLRVMHSRRGAVGDLNDAVQMGSEAVELSVSQPHYHLTLYNLSATLSERFQLLGNVSDLEEAVKLSRSAVAQISAGNPRRHVSLDGLATVLTSRYKQQGDMDDLEEAMNGHLEALELCPFGHPSHGGKLFNLIEALQLRYEHHNSIDDLNAAINLHEGWLTKGNERDYQQSSQLLLAGRSLRLRFEHLGDINDLDRAIHLISDAVDYSGYTRRSACLQDLAYVLRSRFLVLGDRDDLSKAMNLQTASLASLPDIHPSRATALFGLSRMHLLHGAPYFDPSLAIDYAIEALTDMTSNAQLRLKEGVNLLATIQSIPTMKSGDMHVRLLDLHRTAISLLPRVAFFGLELQSRLRVLAKAESLATDAAALALALGRADDAIELLEQGRAVFWSQCLRLRTHFTELPGDLAQSLYVASRQLEQASAKVVAPPLDDSNARASRDGEVAAQRRLAEHFEVLVQQARALPGFERFMLHSVYSSLAHVAERGPVVILLVSTIGSQAIVIKTPSCKPDVVPLPGVSVERLRLYAGGIRMAQQRVRQSNQERGMFKVNQPSVDADARKILRELWTKVMKPVMKLLAGQAINHPNGQRGRIWLCPTNAFTHIPLHAAGIYHADSTDCCSDYAVISYTPTLTALINARTQLAKIKRVTARVLLAGAPKPFKGRSLRYAADEIRLIKHVVPSAAIINLPRQVDCSVNAGAAVSVETILSKLPEASILHLACHGHQDLKNPLDSGFVMDKMLTVSKLMSLELPHAFFAFLSACETAKGDKTQPDQVVHLAATMLFAGFKSVIGTMWSMGDVDGPLVAKKVYEQLFAGDGEYLDPDAIPRALDSAVADLRAHGLHPTRWGPYIHIGV